MDGTLRSTAAVAGSAPLIANWIRRECVRLAMAPAMAFTIVLPTSRYRSRSVGAVKSWYPKAGAASAARTHEAWPGCPARSASMFASTGGSPHVRGDMSVP